MRALTMDEVECVSGGRNLKGGEFLKSGSGAGADGDGGFGGIVDSLYLSLAGVSIIWDNQRTDWAQVIIWGGAGGVAGWAGGPAAAIVGGMAGGLASYYGQHLHIYIDGTL